MQRFWKASEGQPYSRGPASCGVFRLPSTAAFGYGISPRRGSVLFTLYDVPAERATTFEALVTLSPTENSFCNDVMCDGTIACNMMLPTSGE